MSFLSFHWILWLIGTVSLYWLLPGRWRNGGLIAITVAFLLVYAPISAGILAIFSVISYFGSRAQPLSGKVVFLLLGLIFGVLAYYKIQVHASTGEFFDDVAIPLGLSYYAFRCAHYVFERYRETLDEDSFFQYLCFMFFLPTIVVGPINRVKPFYSDLKEKVWSSEMLSEGIERIVYGYAKITILSGFLVNSKLSQFIASLDQSQVALILYLEIVRNALNLYFLFAGYSDIAIGFARLLGYRVMENFNWPFFQKNISDFWRCWHISLSSWCRDYIYFPVMGLTRNPYLATIATFLAIGLWHEISYRYILWGLWHGVGILIWRQFQMTKRRLGLPKVENPIARRLLDGLSIVITANFVWLGFVVVNQPDLASIWAVYKTLFFSWM